MNCARNMPTGEIDGQYLTAGSVCIASAWSWRPRTWVIARHAQISDKVTKRITITILSSIWRRATSIAMQGPAATTARDASEPGMIALSARLGSGGRGSQPSRVARSSRTNRGPSSDRAAWADERRGRPVEPDNIGCPARSGDGLGRRSWASGSRGHHGERDGIAIELSQDLLVGLTELDELRDLAAAIGMRKLDPGRNTALTFSRLQSLGHAEGLIGVHDATESPSQVRLPQPLINASPILDGKVARQAGFQCVSDADQPLRVSFSINSASKKTMDVN